jgi:hypothetical protein
MNIYTFLSAKRGKIQAKQVVEPVQIILDSYRGIVKKKQSLEAGTEKRPCICPYPTVPVMPPGQAAGWSRLVITE